MSAFDDFSRTGQWNDELARLLYEAVRSVATSRNFPTPAEYRSWADDDAVYETAHEFLYGPGGERRVTALLVSATSQASFERLLDTYVQNFLRDQARRTDIGKLVRRINEVAEAEASFEVAAANPRRWRLAGGPIDPSTAPVSALSAALKDVKVVVPAWSSETRDAPAADRASFVGMIHAVLSAADGSVSAADIAHAVAERLDVRRVLPEEALDPMLEIGLEPPDPNAAPDTEVENRDVAVQIFDRLDDNERILHANQGSTVRELGDLLGMSKSRAATMRTALHAKFARLLTAYDDARGALRHLDQLCSDWFRDWTNELRPTSQELTSNDSRTEG